MQQLNPLAFAVAVGTSALVVMLLVGLPMMGMMGYGGHHMMFGIFGVLSWFGIAIPAGIGGAICAWVYNAVNAAWNRNNVKTS